MKGLYREKLEYLEAKYNSKEGIFVWLVGAIIWGFILVNFTDRIYNFFMEILAFLPVLLQKYLAYLFFGLSLVPLGIAITYTLCKVYWLIFKTNGKVI